MLKTFGLAAATLLFVATADTSFAAPPAQAAGFGGDGAMMGGPRSMPRLGPHPANGFFRGDRGDQDFHGDRDFHGDHDFHRDRDFRGDHDFHGDHDRGLPVWSGGWGWPYGWWPNYYEHGEVYPAEAAYPPPPAEASHPPAPPPCPELLHWDPKLGHATRQKLCD